MAFYATKIRHHRATRPDDFDGREEFYMRHEDLRAQLKEARA